MSRTGTASVYVIGGPDGPPYKIGVAKSLKDRLGGIQTGSHIKMAVLFSIELPANAAFRTERITHKSLRDVRLSGEWFGASLEVAISAIKAAAILDAEQAADRGRSPGYVPRRRRRLHPGEPMVPWGIKNISFAARNAALEASRQKGQIVGEWLGEAIEAQVERDDKRYGSKLVVRPRP